MSGALPDGTGPLYARVKALILRRIGDGSWPRDRRLPSEHDLVALTGASRMTVHRALRERDGVHVLLQVLPLGFLRRVGQEVLVLVDITDLPSSVSNLQSRRPQRTG